MSTHKMSVNENQSNVEHGVYTTGCVRGVYFQMYFVHYCEKYHSDYMLGDSIDLFFNDLKLILSKFIEGTYDSKPYWKTRTLNL